MDSFEVIVSPKALFQLNSYIDYIHYTLKNPSPKGEGKWVIKNIVQKAQKQSENIIIDLRRTKLPQEKCINELHMHFRLSKRIKRMKIITKDRELLEYSKLSS